MGWMAQPGPRRQAVTDGAPGARRSQCDRTRGFTAVPAKAGHGERPQSLTAFQRPTRGNRLRGSGPGRGLDRPYPAAGRDGSE